MENLEFINEISAPAPISEETVTKIHLVGIAITTACLGILSGYIVAKKLNHRDELAARMAEAAAGPFVQTAIAARSPQTKIIKELGETRPFQSVTLYAKISGYLNQISVDKGDKVKKGQVLATISSPETFSQYAGAVANSKTKRLTSQRLRQLKRENAATDEETDQAIAAADMAEARVNELAAQKSYSVITAPFDGMVTARFADPGALLQNAANAQSGALPIVTVSQTEKLRVVVFVDQRDAAFVQVGDPVEITVAERPNSRYEARVTRKAGELDSRSRTMLTEIELDNSKGEIVTGSFVDVKLSIATPAQIQVPNEALVMRGTKAFVPVVSEDGIVRYRPVAVGDNDGTKVTITAGLNEGEMVALNIGNNLVEGQHVQTK